jgi:hypothetical protein
VSLYLRRGPNTVQIDRSSVIYSPDLDRIEVPAAAR